MALVPDQKFSTFQDGGDLAVNDIIVGLRGGINTRFTYTGALPVGVVVPIANGGTGANNAVDARTNLGLGNMATQNANAVAITGGSLSGVSAALLSGTVAALAVSGTDIANKNYVDSVVGTAVQSVSGTANRITSTGGANPVIDISASYVGQASITTLGTIATGTWQGTVVGVVYGGTGLSSFNQGDLIYASAANTLTALAKNASATRYLSNTGTTNNPAWAQVDLSNGVTGNLPVTNLNSGTGASATTFWRGDGTWGIPSGSSAGELRSFQVFTSGTGATYTRPAGINSILVEVLGAGGGSGGGAGGVGATGVGGGGGSGGYSRLWIPAAASSYTYTVGVGGGGGSAGNNAGSSGGTTSFGASLQATGGGGGAGGASTSTSTTAPSQGGVGGVGSNGDFNTTGAPGGGAISSGNPISGFGGSSIYGGGALGRIAPQAGGTAGSNYGSGAAGALAVTVSQAGASGSGGLIVVWEYA
jgi:hypothetical protein